MANRKKVGREMEVAGAAAERWEERAALAVEKGRDDLAREALIEKNAMLERVQSLEQEAKGLDEVIESARADIERLEEKLRAAKEKQRVLAARHERAGNSLRAGRQIRKADSTDAIIRFDKFETRIERLEAEAELTHTRNGASLDKTFEDLEKDESLEKELAELKARSGKGKTAKKGEKNQ
jgi:phage shock protein A